MEITLEEELLIQQALAIAILAIEQAPDPDKARASYLLPKIRDEKLWDSKKLRFLMKMSPIYF